jgi:hypothetical protein
MKQKKLLLELVLMISMLLLPMMAQADIVDMEDGEYEVEVTLEGGSGRSTVLSPAILVVKDGKAIARIEWSSGNYDYMLVAGEKYLPLTRDPHSVFEIPVTALGEPMAVTADTTAMSVPHEVDYTLTFAVRDPGSSAQLVVICAAAAVALAGVILVVKKKGMK